LAHSANSDFALLPVEVNNLKWKISQWIELKILHYCLFKEVLARFTLKTYPFILSQTKEPVFDWTSGPVVLERVRTEDKRMSASLWYCFCLTTAARSSVAMGETLQDGSSSYIVLLQGQDTDRVRMNLLLIILMWLCAIMLHPFSVYWFWMSSTHTNWIISAHL
jgi:hypothetical protein